MEKYYRFAGVEITVDIPDELMYEEERHLAPFRVNAVSDPHIFQFEVVERLLPPKGQIVAKEGGFRIYQEEAWTVYYTGSVQKSCENANIRAAHRGKEHRIQLKQDGFSDRVGVRTVLNVMRAEHLIARAGAFIFHCAYIDRNGKAILFTAPSETGKSTQADLWKLFRGTEIINGDRAAVRIADGRILAEGIPFSGSSQYCCNRSLPIEAIVYLGQAPTTSIRQMRGYEAFARIWEGVSVNTRDKTDTELVSGAVQQVVQNIPIFYLSCTPDESAVIALEQALESR